MTLWAIYVTAQFDNGEIWHRRYWGYMREVADPYFVGSRVEIEIVQHYLFSTEPGRPTRRELERLGLQRPLSAAI